MTTVTVNGTTYDSATSFSEYLYLTALLSFASDLLADTTKALTATSATSAVVGTGSKTFVMATAVPFGVGAFVLVADNAAPTTNYMFGQVTARSGTTLDLTSIFSAGSGTLSDWTISISGARGEAGSLAGNATGAIDMNGYAIILDAVTLSAAVNGADQEVSRVTLKDYGETRVPVTGNGSTGLNIASGNVFDVTLTGNTTFVFQNPSPSGLASTMTVRLGQDGTGGWTTTWPGTVVWAGGNTPVVSSAANAIDFYTFITLNEGGTWYGFNAGQEFS